MKSRIDEFDEAFKAFLLSKKSSTRSTYSSLLRFWTDFTHMDGKASLEFRKADTDAKTEKLIVAFKGYVEKLKKEDGTLMGENTAKTAQGAIRGFFRFNRARRLEFIPTELKELKSANRKTQDYLFSKEDLAKMSELGNLDEKYVVLVGKSIGFRAGDFLKFTYGDFRSVHVDGEAPIALGEVVNQKEHTRAFPFLDSDAVAIVKLILERDKDAKDEDRILKLDEQSLTLTLKRLFEKAHLISGKKIVRFHSLRKYLITKLSAVASESQWKQVVGKSIDESAYVSQDELREVYSRAMPSIVVNGSGKNHAKVEALEEAVLELTKQLKAKDAIIEVLEKNQKDTENTMNKILSLPTVAKEFRNQKETVPID